MSVLIKHMAMPKGCIYANDKDQTEYCPLLNHDDVPFCQYIEDEPEAAIGIDERPVYCPLYDVPKPCKDTVSRQDAIDGVKMLHDVAWKNWHEPTLSANVVLDMIRELPSAQPEIIACGQGELVQDGSRLVQDCIDRQAAIDAMEQAKEQYFDRRVIIGKMQDIVSNLPSAQPEIIRCGKCMHKDKKIDYCHYLGITICEHDYCSYAERRTDETD